MTQKDVDMRPNYFPGQYLLEDDFQLEQEYHSDRQRRHHRLFISPGIAEGLVVTKLDGLRINITSGTAIDKKGRQIVLSNEKSGAIELNKISSSNLTNGEYTLSIEYDEKQTLLQEGTTGNRRWEESPKFTLKTQPDESDSIPLAKLKIEGDTVSIINDEKIRKYAGVRLPSSDPTQAPIIGFQGATINVEGNQYIKGNLTVAETIYAGGNPIAYENYEINLLGSFAGGSSSAFLKIANIGVMKDIGRGLNTVILNPNGTFKKQENHDNWDKSPVWNTWATWVNQNAKIGDIVAVASHDALSNAPTDGFAKELLQEINAKIAFSIVPNSASTSRYPYALLFIKGQSSCIEVSQPTQGATAHIKTTYYQLLTLQYIKQQEEWQTPIFGGLKVKTNQPNSSIELCTSGTNDVQIANREGRLAISTQNGGDALNILDSGNVGIGTTSPTEKLEVNGGNLKVSGNITAVNASFTNNLTVAGTIYAGGNPIAYENYEIYLRGTATDSPDGNNTFFKIANVVMGMDPIRGLNTVILNPNGTFKKKENHNIWNNQNVTWDNWADWIDKNADTGDIVAVGSSDAISDVPISNVPKKGSGETLLQKINAKKVLSGLGNVPRRPYALLFIKGQSSCIEVLQPHKGNAAQIKTTYYQLLTLQYIKQQEEWQTPIFGGLKVIDGGKVGIGTDNPTEQLEVKGNLKASGSVTGADGVFTGKIGIGTITPASQLHVVSGDETVASFKSDKGSAYLKLFNNTIDDAAVGIRNYDGKLGLSVYSPNDKKILDHLTINSIGNVGIGTWEQSEKLEVNGNLKASNATFNGNLKASNATFNGNVSIGTGSPKEKLYVEGNLYVSGNIYAEGQYWGKTLFWQEEEKNKKQEDQKAKTDIWRRLDLWKDHYAGWLKDDKNTTYPSDLNLKQNILPIANALDKLEKLKPVSFHWSDLNYFLKDIDAEFPDSVDRSEEEIEAVNKIKAKAKTHLEKQQFGFIAQDVEQVLPEWVTTGEDSYKRIDMSQLNALLVQSIQELKIAHDSSIAENKALKQRIERLEEKVNHLTA
jgi:Chaperone of endosialidase